MTNRPRKLAGDRKTMAGPVGRNLARPARSGFRTTGSRNPSTRRGEAPVRTNTRAGRQRTREGSRVVCVAKIPHHACIGGTRNARCLALPSGPAMPVQGRNGGRDDGGATRKDGDGDQQGRCPAPPAAGGAAAYGAGVHRLQGGPHVEACALWDFSSSIPLSQGSWERGRLARMLISGGSAPVRARRPRSQGLRASAAVG